MAFNDLALGPADVVTWKPDGAVDTAAVVAAGNTSSAFVWNAVFDHHIVIHLHLHANFVAYLRLGRAAARCHGQRHVLRVVYMFVALHMYDEVAFRSSGVVADFTSRIINTDHLEREVQLAHVRRCHGGQRRGIRPVRLVAA